MRSVRRRDRALSELAQQFIGLLKADADFSEEMSTANGAAKALKTAESA